jgi:hypothetical protein
LEREIQMLHQPRLVRDEPTPY